MTIPIADVPRVAWA